MNNIPGLVDSGTFTQAIASLGYPSHFHHKGTRISWVNWREKGGQITFDWNGHSMFRAYICFNSYAERDRVLQQAFKTIMPEGAEPHVRDAHTIYSERDYSIETEQVISVHAVAKLAQDAGIEFTIVFNAGGYDNYRQAVSTICGSEVVPGEMGKEWINGEVYAYSCPAGKCL